MNNEIQNSESLASVAEIASVLGYGEFLGKTVEMEAVSPMEATATQPLNDDNLVSTSELLEDSPASSKTEANFSNSPFSKLGLVGLGLFVVFAAGGGFLSTVMSSKPSKTPAVAASPHPSPTPTPQIAEAESEVGNLKTQVALAQQEDKLKAVEESSSAKLGDKPKTVDQKTETAPKTSATTSTATRTPPRTTASTSPPPRYSRSSPPVRSTSPAPAPTRVARANPPAPRRATSVAARTPVRTAIPVVANPPAPRTATPVAARTPVRTATPVAANPPAPRTATPVAARTPSKPTPSYNASKPSDSPQRIATAPNSGVASTQAKPTSSVNPQEEWLALSQLGSYGTNEQVENSTTTAETRAETRTASLDSSATAANSTTAVTMPRAIPVVSSNSTGGVPFPAPAVDNVAQTNDAVLASNTMSLPAGAIPFPSETNEDKSDIAAKNTESAKNSVDSENSESIAQVNKEEENILNGTPVPEASGTEIAEGATPASLALDTSSTATATLAAQELPPAQLDAIVLLPVAEEQSFLSSTQSRRLQVGTDAKGQLTSSAVYFSEGKNPQQFIVQLKEPLVESNGAISLPSGTVLVATVDQVSSTGVATVSTSRVLIDGQEYVLPEGAISLYGENGEPLIASKSGDKGSLIASRDMTAFALGSLAKVGEMMNRPDVETSTSTSGTSVNQTTTSRSGNRNILGAVLEGGFSPLASELLRRNQQATAEAMKSPDTWSIPAGQNVQIVVARSFEF